MSIVQYTEQEQRLTNTLRLTTEALKSVTEERDAQRKVLERIKAQEPAAWYDEEMDCAYTASELDGGTAHGLAPLFLAAWAQVQAQPVQQEPAAWEHCFVDPSKKILSYTKTCAGFPPRDDAYQINPLYAQPVQQEPVLYQRRMRPEWRESEWFQWETCTKECADDFERKPILNNWIYEVRRLYAAPVQAQEQRKEQP